MDIAGLKIFLAVARTGSISRAAENLNCVQSNVTARIKQLEQQLGTALFRRMSKGVILTPSGNVLLEYAEKIIRLAREAEEAVTNQDGPKGKLFIGSMETTAAVRLPPLLSAYHRSFPEVELNLMTGTSEESLQRLLEFRIDGAFVAGDLANDAVVAVRAFEEELVLVAPPGISSIDRIDCRKILVFRMGCSYRAQLEAWLRKTGRLPYQVIEFGSIEGIIGCISAGMGISILPCSIVERPQHRGNCSVFGLPGEIGAMTTWFVRRSREKPGKAMQAFMELALPPLHGGQGPTLGG